MFKDQIALALRVLVFYPLAGILAALPSIDYDQAAQVLTIDLDAASVVVGGIIWAAVSGSTFAWSRIAKSIGGAV